MQAMHDRRSGPCRGAKSHRDAFGVFGGPCTCQRFALQAVKFDGPAGGWHTAECPCWYCQDGHVKFPTPESAEAALASVALLAQAAVLTDAREEAEAAFARDQLDQRAAGRVELAGLTPRRWIGSMNESPSPSYRSSMQDAGRGGLLR